VALSLSIRVIGGSIGYAIYFSIFSETLRKALPERVGAAVVAAGLPAGDATQFVDIFLTTPMAVSTAPGASPGNLCCSYPRKSGCLRLRSKLRMVHVDCIWSCCYWCRCRLGKQPQALYKPQLPRESRLNRLTVQQSNPGTAVSIQLRVDRNHLTSMTADFAIVGHAAPKI
jgi:hypothetical protein